MFARRLVVCNAVAMYALLTLFSSSTTKRSTRFMVRALVNRPITTSTASNRPNSQLRTPNSLFGATATTTTQKTPFAFLPSRPSLSTTSKLDDVALEEDLDAALDDILGETTSSEEVGRRHIKGSKPMPRELIEREDPKDPDFLSTSNPRWIAAGIDQVVIDVLSRKGITHFTPVQAEAFDPIAAGRDVIGRSRTGTGKTLAFGMPSITRLLRIAKESGKMQPDGRMRRGRQVSMIILCPTRELARQVQEELAGIAKPQGLYAEVVHGGVGYEPQAKALRDGVDILVGTPGRVMDHMNRGNLKLDECNIAVLDEADEMLNMGFAEDVEVILKDVGKANEEKTQCLLFSATTPAWVKEIGRSYQKDVLAIDSTGDEGGARVATTVRHLAVQIPPGAESKRAVLEDIIAVEISKDSVDEESDDDEAAAINPLAAAAKKAKRTGSHAIQQKIFGKTIVFVETKKEADELVSGGVFKSLTAQALHGDVGQKQRDATLNAFRAGAFNVLVATDVAARGIDIRDVDLVVQFDPPRDVDSYVHRSGRTGRAGKKGVSVLLFNGSQARDIVRIERDLGHGFKFDLVGPPSSVAALQAAARTSAIASKGIPDDTAHYFKESAAALLEEAEDPVHVVARCLAAISRRSTEVQSRSLITGEANTATIQLTNSRGRPVSSSDVMFTISKLSKMSQSVDNLAFSSDVGRIVANEQSGTAMFDMSLEDAKRLVEFSKDIDAGGCEFSILKELEILRDHNFGRGSDNGRGGRFENNRGGDRRNGGFRSNDRFSSDRNGGRRYERGHGSRDGGSSRSDGNRFGSRDGGSSRSDGNRFGSRDGGGSRSEGNRFASRFDRFDRSEGSNKFDGRRSSGSRQDDNRSGGFKGRYDSSKRQPNDEW